MVEIFDKVLNEALKDPNGCVEIRSAGPNDAPWKFTWRARVAGRGVFVGRADKCWGEDGEECIAFDHPHSLIPED